MREVDFTIGESAAPYMLRWWLLPRNKVFNVYLHKFMRSDADDALHDHPWFNMSVLLEGSYVEHTIAAGGVHKRVLRKAGQFKVRSPWAAHRVEIDQPCWTLFITGPVMRDWGFHCPNGWRMWKDFVAMREGGNQSGRGCND